MDASSQEALFNAARDVANGCAEFDTAYDIAIRHFPELALGEPESEAANVLSGYQLRRPRRGGRTRSRTTGRPSSSLAIPTDGGEESRRQVSDPRTPVAPTRRAAPSQRRVGVGHVHDTRQVADQRLQRFSQPAEGLG